MHRALSISEVVREICAFNSESGDLKSLAALAQTCTQIYELAVQELWKDIEDFVPLAKCFPEDSWEIVAGELTFTRSLAPEDWQRLLHYSQHVRRITLQGHGLSSPTCWLHSSALSAMAISRPTAILFPKVQVFDWNCADFDVEDLGVILGFLGSHVKYLDVYAPDLLGHQSAQRLRDAFFLIARQFPRLERFGFGEPMDSVIRRPPPFPEALLLPQTLSNLTTFCFYVPTTEDVIYALARLPSLQKLRITLPFNSKWPVEGPPNAFASLRHLFLRVTGLDYVAFSAVCRFPNVEDAHLDIIDVPDQATVSAMFRSVREQFSVTSLRELRISCADDNPAMMAEMVDSVVRLAHLGHLFVFTRLQRLELTMACRYALDDDFYHDVAKAFPQLGVLTIADDSHCPHDSLPSMTALVPFALHRSLHTLSLPFDGTHGLSLDDIRNALPVGSRPSQLKNLGVGYSSVTDPQLVATYLTRLFPGIGGDYGSFHFAESGDSDEGLEQYECWSRVQQLLSYFHLIREHERSIASSS